MHLCLRASEHGASSQLAGPGSQRTVRSWDYYKVKLHKVLL